MLYRYCGVVVAKLGFNDVHTKVLCGALCGLLGGGCEIFSVSGLSQASQWHGHDV